jgi:hypothetical protein
MVKEERIIMKQYRVLSIFAALMLLVGLACGLFTPDPTPVPPPTSAPAQDPDPSNNQGSSDIITVEDQNKLYMFDIPANWSYEANDLGNAVYSDVYMYADTWTSPDESAVVEGISGRSEGFDFDGTTSTRVALDMLNYYYSFTGQEGDIRISETSTAEDGSTRFDWESKGGDYSGISWFEVRGDRTFLMWTMNWGNAADQATLDVLLNAQNTYQAQPQ